MSRACCSQRELPVLALQGGPVAGGGRCAELALTRRPRRPRPTRAACPCRITRRDGGEGEGAGGMAGLRMSKGDEETRGDAGPTGGGGWEGSNVGPGLSPAKQVWVGALAAALGV